ncbi:MAG TPA: adenylate/guanylate cyclase domain-containing protein [Anaerolineales bacterium]|nr:adenylate/guanylate cyclase domain-containing protein [Anaerolineales bacterium]
MTPKPSGTVAFLFTDIEGSTVLAQRHPDKLPALLTRHREILQRSIESHQGYIFQVVGDSFSAAFHSASDALGAALDAQIQLHYEDWGDAPIKVRMGIHTGIAELADDPNTQGPYSGYATIALTQRIMSVGHGGQILVSQTTYELARDTQMGDSQFIDMGEHHLKSILRPVRLYQLNAPRLPFQFPALKSLDYSPHNLPEQLTSFVGREQDIVEITNLLGSARLVTLTGSGGTGKTRLSLQVAAEQVGNFQDGVWLIELASLQDPAYLISTIASTFSLREAQGSPLQDTVTDFLRTKHMLLILDNCEHLVEACADLANHLLHTCSKLKLIATSREALDIDGETIFRVPSLKETESSKLFVERARKIDPRFRWTERNAEAIAQICVRLDGIPLAIELAAARIKLFTPDQIAQRLDDRFKLLSGGSRTALPRQQTLRALIDWSYQSLNEIERQALCRLAVFAGGWSYDAAEAVIGAEQALDGLSGLINKSLINVEEQESEARYHFLETIRQYALEKLQELQNAAEPRDRHLDYFFTYAKREEENRLDSRKVTWVQQFEIEQDNFRSALHWALENRPKAALELVYLLSNFWLTRGLMTEGCDWCRAALARAESLSRQPDLVLALTQVYLTLAMLSVNHGQHLAAQTAAKEGVELARQLDDAIWLVRSLNFLGLASAFAGDETLAFKSLQEGESLCRKWNYQQELAELLQSLAYVTLELRGQRAVEQVQAYLEESLSVSQGSANINALVMTEGTMARLAFYKGNFQEARKHADRMLALHEEMGDQLSVTAHNSEVAHILRESGNIQEAFALYKKTIQEWREFGHRGAVAHQLECLAFIAKAREQGERAVRLMGAAEALREVSNSPMTPTQQMLYDREVAELRTGLDEPIFAALWAEGRNMTVDQAIDYALEENRE